jgi:hypothetical protein
MHVDRSGGRAGYSEQRSERERLLVNETCDIIVRHEHNCLYRVVTVSSDSDFGDTIHCSQTPPSHKCQMSHNFSSPGTTSEDFLETLLVPQGSTPHLRLPEQHLLAPCSPRAGSSEATVPSHIL